MFNTILVRAAKALNIIVFQNQCFWLAFALVYAAALNIGLLQYSLRR